MAQTDVYKEHYRPQYHFSPSKNWCNDPNGLVYNKGTYHLFYQHNPFDNVWGHMTWAHATSKDLLHWKHEPIAIAEDSAGMIFSGTCIVDNGNTTGLRQKNGSDPMIAIYTNHVENVKQSQHMAYSLDNGQTWTKYANNPILDLGKKDFRDPKVFWYAPKNYWVMAVMLPVEHIVQFYSSANLKEWKHLSNFGPAGDTSGVWECPDLTQVPVENAKGKKKWLLQMSMNASMQYFVGEFDGVTFTNENPVDKIYRPDYGPDYYAAICYNQLPSAHKPIAVGWVNNWNYANDIPTKPWKGAMSLPRTLSVKKINNEWVLVQKPLELVLKNQKLLYKDYKAVFDKPFDLPAKSGQFYFETAFGSDDTAPLGIRLSSGQKQNLEFGYDPEKKVLYLKRSNVSNSSFNSNFDKLNYFETSYKMEQPLVTLQIFCDNSIVEVFINGGEKVFTAQIFPDRPEQQITLFAGKRGALSSCRLIQIKPTW